MKTIRFPDKEINKRQLIDELKGLNLPNLAFAGLRRSNRRILKDGSIERDQPYLIEVKLRATVSVADERRIAAVVENHGPQPVLPTRLDVLRESNAAFKRGQGSRLTTAELRELTELSL